MRSVKHEEGKQANRISKAFDLALIVLNTSTLTTSYKGVMYRPCGLRLSPNFGSQPAVGKNFFFYWVRKCKRLRLLQRNVCGHAAVVARIFQLWVIAEVQKLKYQVKLLKCKPLKYKSSL